MAWVSSCRSRDNRFVELRPSYPISTLRLRLRPLSLGDTEEVLAYRGRADVCRYLPFEPMDEQVLAARLAGDLGRREITAEGSFWNGRHRRFAGNATNKGLEIADVENVRRHGSLLSNPRAAEQNACPRTRTSQRD